MQLLSPKSATGLPLDDMARQLREQIASAIGMAPGSVQVVVLVAVPHTELMDYGTTLSQANTGHACQTIANSIAVRSGGGKIILPS